MEDKHALIIAGETVLHSFLCKHLGRLGIRCSAAYTAKAGLKILEDLQPDIIFVNDKLPDGRGREVVQYLRSNGQRETPLVTMSYEAEQMETYKSRHLVRPIRLSALKSHLRELLGGN